MISGPASERRVAAALDLARDQLQIQLAAKDSDDLKSLGFFAADLAGAAAVFTSRDIDGGYWWVPVAMFGAAGLLMLAVLFNRSFPSGPVPLLVYYSDSGTPILDTIIALQLAAQQVAHNRSKWTRRLPYRVSLWLLVLGIAMTGIVVTVLR